MELKAKHVLKVGEYEFPLDRLYYREKNAHVWVKKDGDAVLIGIDAFLAENAGYLNYISITADRLKKGEAFANIESAKFVSKLYSPIDGEVLEVNEEVIQNPRLINDSPYEAWILRAKAVGEIYHEDLLGEQHSLAAWIREEIARLEEE